MDKQQDNRGPHTIGRDFSNHERLRMNGASWFLTLYLRCWWNDEEQLDWVVVLWPNKPTKQIHGSTTEWSVYNWVQQVEINIDIVAGCRSKTLIGSDLMMLMWRQRCWEMQHLNKWFLLWQDSVCTTAHVEQAWSQHYIDMCKWNIDLAVTPQCHDQQTTETTRSFNYQ